ncbi:serine/threonine-protein kinase [Kribbella solani]|uniref:serine/threonine-protein kinase n=1 Tax=Kribbella solani TaxID=236067 RepID=UPI0029B02192|nr:serine/threonine-protein kinase [Kribbella solani]MDX2968059.1 serine/threonine-protein kinase [Kribbella solani]
MPSRYTDARRISEGGATSIWTATDVQRGEEVVLKIPHVEDYKPYVLGKFTDEHDRTARFQHPNIVRAFDLDATATEFTPYVAVELVRGQTMNERLSSDGALDLGRVADVGAQLTDALRTVHAADLVHRDINPDNVMITPDGQVKLIDFGNSSRTGDPDVELSVGTWGYAAPELADASNAIRNRRPNFEPPLPDPATDVYGAGLTLHEAATGQVVFGAHGSRFAQADGQVPRLSAVRDDVPPALDQLIADMTAKDPADRPTAAEASVALRSIAAELRAESTQSAPAAEAGLAQRVPDLDHLRSMLTAQPPAGQIMNRPATPAESSTHESSIPPRHRQAGGPTQTPRID